MDSKTPNSKIVKVEKVLASYLFQSDFYQIKDWTFDFEEEKQSSQGFNDCLCVVFVRKGNFHFDLSKESYDMHSGHIIIDKPNYEYRLRPSSGQCSIFNFTDDFYRQFLEDMNLKQAFFFSNSNLLSLLLKSNPETEYLHYQILKNSAGGSKLEIDNLVLQLLKDIVSTITNSPLDEELETLIKSHHLVTIERAKEYMNENFATDISLFQIASYAHVSPFHFSRIFKKITSFSPYHYLQNIRLKHAEMLLKSTTLPISEISFASGFNNADYFATAFKQKYKVPPTGIRGK